jgi:hypothetical protein
MSTPEPALGKQPTRSGGPAPSIASRWWWDGLPVDLWDGIPMGRCCRRCPRAIDTGQCASPRKLQWETWDNPQ